jgi:hypothetical protein
MARTLSLTVAAAALLAGVLGTPTRADESGSGTKAGTLVCDVSSGWGFIFGSSRDLKCSFTDNKNTPDHYEGHIKKFGVDIGYTAGGVIAWAVLAPSSDVASSDVAKGALAGTYAGVTGSATVGGGVGANVLVGGGNNSFSLQPLSVEGNTGLNVAGGIAAIELDHTAYTPRP